MTTYNIVIDNCRKFLLKQNIDSECITAFEISEVLAIAF